jgi:hypothetical protein
LTDESLDKPRRANLGFMGDATDECIEQYSPIEKPPPADDPDACARWFFKYCLCPCVSTGQFERLLGAENGPIIRTKLSKLLENAADNKFDENPVKTWENASTQASYASS